MVLISPKAFAFVGYSFVLGLLSVIALIGFIAAFGIFAGLVAVILIAFLIPVFAGYLAGYRRVALIKLMAVLIVINVLVNAVIPVSSAETDAAVVIVKSVFIYVTSAVIAERI